MVAILSLVVGFSGIDLNRQVQNIAGAAAPRAPVEYLFPPSDGAVG